MTDDELLDLLREGEITRVERKRSAADLETLRRNVCALSNDLPGSGRPGVLFIGVEDDGSCVDLEITTDLLDRLHQLRLDGKTQPVPSMTVERRTLDGCTLAAIIVHPTDLPPMRSGHRIWVRSSAGLTVATKEEERRIAERRRAFDLPYDSSPVASATLDDLNLDSFQQTYLPSAFPEDVLEENDRTVLERLQALRLASPDGRPTVAAILAFGRDPRHFVPGSYIQFLRIDGTELVDPILDSHILDGTLSDILHRADDLAQINIKTSSDYVERPVEVRQPDYPIAALRQILRNAVLHRSYEGIHSPVRWTWYRDRIEIQSPGGPHGIVNRKNFGQPGIASYRNPALAEAMSVLGFVQRFGTGLEIARRSLAANGNPPPEFEVTDDFVSVVLRTAVPSEVDEP